MITWPPALVPVNSQWWPDGEPLRLVSPFTRTVQEVDRGGLHWRASLTLPPLLPVRAGALQGLLAQLAVDPVVALPDHAWTGNGGTLASATVYALQGSLILDLTDCAPLDGWVGVGDRIGIGHRVYVVTAPAQAVAGGMAVRVQPAVRELAHAVPVILTPREQTVAMQLANGWLASTPSLPAAGPAPQLQPQLAPVTLEATEVMPS
ncbi:MAG: hypothetical protein AAFX81_15955 [Pseudomonadota bacterium]